MSDSPDERGSENDWQPAVWLFEAELLRDLPVDFFDNLFSDFDKWVVDPVLMEKFENGRKNLQWEQIPKELRIVDDEWLRDIDKKNTLITINECLAAAESRFGENVSDQSMPEVFSKVFVPKSTESNTLWAVRNFEVQYDWWWKKTPEESDPEDLLELMEFVARNKWLSLYLIETRCTDGKKFPSITLDCLLSGLYRHARKLNPNAVNLLDEKDTEFSGLVKQ